MIDTERTIKSVADEIVAGPQTLDRWVAAERELSPPAKRRTVKELEAQNSWLAKELYEARKNNEFLDKAASFFAEEASGSKTV